MLSEQNLFVCRGLTVNDGNARILRETSVTESSGLMTKMVAKLHSSQ